MVNLLVYTGLICSIFVSLISGVTSQLNQNIQPKTNLYAGLSTEDIIKNAKIKIENDNKIANEIIYYSEDELRQKIVDTAVSVQGIPSYEWGKKYYDLNDKNTITQNDSLDCSGFVQWVYLNSLNIDTGEGTANISENTEEITYDELKIGDLGLIFKGGSYYIDENGNRFSEPVEGARCISNHIGIYIGKDENGNDLWVHCNKKENTVSINSPQCFSYYCKVSLDNILIEKKEE